MTHRMRRRGVSLVEIGIFLPIGLMVVGLAWTFFSGSAKTQRRADAKLQGVQANLLLAMQLERDLEALYETPQYQLGISPDKRALQFWRCQEGSPEEDWDPLPIERITYQFDPASSRVFRTVGDGQPKALHGFFDRVHFHANQPKSPDDADVGAPLPLTGTVYFWSVAIPQEDFEKPAHERDPFRASTLFSAVSRKWYTGRHSYPFWNPVPYYPPPP